MELKPEALSGAYFDVKSKRLTIKTHGIKPDMTNEERDAVAKTLAEAKGSLNRQRHYVDFLVELSALTVQQHLEKAYAEKFEVVSNEVEKENSLKHSDEGFGNKKVFAAEAIIIEEQVCQELELSREHENENEIHLEDLFILGKSHRILDEASSSNGKRLLSLLKENTNVIAEEESEGGRKHKFHINSWSMHNVYEYNGLVLTVTAFSPRSGKYTSYDFVCSSKYR